MPRESAGKSLRPVLADPAATIKDAAFTLVTRGPKAYGRSVRTTRWRFTRWSDGQAELYDHDRDPEEHHNLARTHPDVVAELEERLEAMPPYRPSR
jgi:hypothetical protein